MTRPIVEDDGTPAPTRNLSLTPDDAEWVCLVSNHLHWDLYLMLGEGDLNPEGGAATYNEVTAPQEKSITEWDGVSSWKLDVPIMLDSWISDIETPDPARRKEPPKFGALKKKRKRVRAREHWRHVRNHDGPDTVDGYVQLLVDLSQPKDEGEEPPTIRLYGKAIPRYLNGEPWKISSIAWGARLGRHGRLRRQAATLSLLEANSGDRYKLKHRKGRPKGNGGKHQKYTIKKGDTLQSIAAKFYGDPHKWERIAEANGIKNPRRLTVGDVIKIP